MTGDVYHNWVQAIYMMLFILDNAISIPHYSNAHTILPNNNKWSRNKNIGPEWGGGGGGGGNLWTVEQKQNRGGKWSRIRIGLPSSHW